MPDVQTQAVTGLTPPERDEARIRERWPSIAKFSGVASLGRVLTRTIILAPLGWLLMGPFFALKYAPVLARRYAVTNRRVMIRAGWSGKPIEEVALKDIDEVRIQGDANTDFFRAATIEIVSAGKVVLTLPGTPEADAFRMTILNAVNAWVPNKTKQLLPFIAASEK